MLSEEPRVGVYVCHCGLNIAGVVDVKQVVEYAKTLPNVVVAKDYTFMCSAPGQQMIKDDVKAQKLNRVVVAACSPSLHEPTFRRATKEAGLNPYLMEMVNIREHCSWVHPQEKDAATEKAKDLVRMAVAKARLLEPLDTIVSKVEPCALVLGGGVAGLEAALDLAKRGAEVYLVEKAPTLGGNAARLGKLAFSNMRGVELVKTLVDAVKSNPKIRIFTNAELVGLDGSVGNFKAKIKINPRFVNEKCNLCGKCVEVCPVEVPNEYEFNLSKRKAIYLPYAEAYPPIYVIDTEKCTKCRKCIEVCKPGAINLEDKGSEIEARVGCVILAIGYTPYEPYKGEYGYGTSPNVITLFQLERLLDPTGPTKGQLLIDGKAPNAMAFIMCVGSLTTSPTANVYCSRMCCTTSLKDILEIKEQYPDTALFVLYKHMRTYGRLEERLYEKASEKGVVFVRFEEPPKVKVKRDGIELKVYDLLTQENLEIPVDMVVLAVGMNPSKELEKVRSITKVGCTPDGFVREAHLKLRPVETPSDGIFLAGTVSGPRNITESVISGSAAAAKAAVLISKEQVEVEPIIARVIEDVCSGCGTCVAQCPFGAISIKEVEGKRQASVDAMLCKGCGTCAAACPSGAMQQANFKDHQIVAQVEACFR